MKLGAKTRLVFTSGFRATRVQVRLRGILSSTGAFESPILRQVRQRSEDTSMETLCQADSFVSRFQVQH